VINVLGTQPLIAIESPVLRRLGTLEKGGDDAFSPTGLALGLKTGLKLGPHGFRRCPANCGFPRMLFLVDVFESLDLVLVKPRHVLIQKRILSI
jgi:hypothetical protein